MVIDTSALVAILFQEPDAPRLAEAIEADPSRLVSAATLLEAAMVCEGRAGPSAGRHLDLLLHDARVAVVPFDLDQAEAARRAWRRFGKGNHPAALNFGDCISYALSVTSDEPLLFQGDDFARTDVAVCPLPPAR